MTDLAQHFSELTASKQSICQFEKGGKEAEALKAVQRMDPYYAQETAAILAAHSPSYPDQAYMWLQTTPDGITQIHTLDGDR